MVKVYLNEICRPKQWKTISSSNLLDAGYPVYGANGIIGYYSKYTHENPTVLITCRGATCGKINISKPKSYVNGNAMALDNLSDDVDLYFLKYYLESRGLDDVISGSAQPQITRTNLSKLKIPLPPLSTQKRIAEILDNAAALRDKTKQLLSEYDQLAQSIFLDMFGDPVTNPKGWEKDVFKKHLIDVKNGITRRPKTEEDKSGQIVLKLKHIRSNFINYDCENRILLDESEKKKFTVNIGDLLFIRVNGNPDYVGRCALHDNNDYEVFFNDHIMRVRVDLNTFNSVFLSQYLNYPYGQREIYKRVKTSAGQHTINQGGLEKLNLISPPIKLQNQFAEKIALIEQQKDLAKQELQESEDLFQALLQRAFLPADRHGKGELV